MCVFENMISNLFLLNKYFRFVFAASSLARQQAPPRTCNEFSTHFPFICTVKLPKKLYTYVCTYIRMRTTAIRGIFWVLAQIPIHAAVSHIKIPIANVKKREKRKLVHTYIHMFKYT
ncbi:unnamed protein product [Ceratitis capitata]|uniref:(Mediterranean fruit fly) hypothetical protein n=1 Tax=Ceratitis capitata TaxID=7213 RepID=A0A811VF81_CERCA|nr:unnamed protein product [Ceratitis capitata]